MTTPNDNAAHTTASSPDPSVYVYASAGIGERKGSVPLWLWGVVVSLLIWGVYYLVTYWNAPIGPT
jgi:hypothetical protein